METFIRSSPAAGGDGIYYRSVGIIKNDTLYDVLGAQNLSDVHRVGDEISTFYHIYYTYTKQKADTLKGTPNWWQTTIKIQLLWFSRVFIRPLTLFIRGNHKVSLSCYIILSVKICVSHTQLWAPAGFVGEKYIFTYIELALFYTSYLRLLMIKSWRSGVLFPI